MGFRLLRKDINSTHLLLAALIARSFDPRCASTISSSILVPGLVETIGSAIDIGRRALALPAERRARTLGRVLGRVDLTGAALTRHF